MDAEDLGLEAFFYGLRAGEYEQDLPPSLPESTAVDLVDAGSNTDAQLLLSAISIALNPYRENISCNLFIGKLIHLILIIAVSLGTIEPGWLHLTPEGNSMEDQTRRMTSRPSPPSETVEPWQLHAALEKGIMGDRAGRMKTARVNRSSPYLSTRPSSEYIIIILNILYMIVIILPESIISDYPPLPTNYHQQKHW